MSQENEYRVRSAYEAFARGDIGAVIGLLDPHVEWTETEGGPYAGTYNGPDAVLNEVFKRLGADWDGFKAVPEEFIDGGDTIVVLGKYGGRYRATGKSLRAGFVHVWTLYNAKVVRFRQIADTALMQAAIHPSLGTETHR